MAALIRRFRTFPEPQPPAELLSNAAANERVPWASKTGDGSVVASILMPLYILTVAFGVLLPRPLVTIGAAFLLAGVKLGVCMSVCLHRWAAHGAFSCSYPFAVVLSVLGCLATQGGPVWWGSKHRVHHAYCEKARDPHSPRWRLFVVCAFSWFGKENKYVDLEHVPLHLEGTLLLLINTYSFLPTLVELACAFRYFGVTGLYISYVAGALCKGLQTPNVFFAMVQEVTWPYTFLIGLRGLVWGVKHYMRAEHKWEGATAGGSKGHPE
ncbi:hypothetical protein EMIHUDRAFT_217011 [Emiliania huxleyi CCMP1516]|uniref:Fatty acid desaturase domain-containing protein n=2 Tax=Emiliania huxleyi TaxID=2903 RepID=A0A0D3IBY3_EMIH1|nr:hypothetical protein EMIHUDRAFT_217011 [Emiliania huxleyi CCMP1516]EOD08768.1 hypothetical protein EMIHUDRAFT_217011 [Emiliania huxleyi CCMP1516]|eukprot:XP_005761197.1 hypothetical protein EMIHUDRAFT_217011 [Emiliania huxleyi CCMP1516]